MNSFSIQVNNGRKKGQSEPDPYQIPLSRRFVGLRPTLDRNVVSPDPTDHLIPDSAKDRPHPQP
ncbi:MAG: hypothetical protein K8L91_08615, partial [Anaerolineae bacterium]|nr:hypothetical protein [Anaerolineae bacterium]